MKRFSIFARFRLLITKIIWLLLSFSFLDHSFRLLQNWQRKKNLKKCFRKKKITTKEIGNNVKKSGESLYIISGFLQFSLLNCQWKTDLYTLLPHTHTYTWTIIMMMMNKNPRINLLDRKWITIINGYWIKNWWSSSLQCVCCS